MIQTIISLLLLFSAQRRPKLAQPEADRGGAVGEHSARDERADRVREPTAPRPPPHAGSPLHQRFPSNALLPI